MRLGRSPEKEYLKGILPARLTVVSPALGVAQQDNRGGGPRPGGLTEVDRLGRSGLWKGRHPATVSPRASGNLRPMSTSTTGRWICESCGWIYDPAEGDPDGGIPPGTAFKDIPDDWFCPVCGARTSDFEPYED